MRYFAYGFILAALLILGMGAVGMFDPPRRETVITVKHIDRADQRDHIRIVRGPTEYVATPRCPSEDSCRVDYRDGVWYVVPTIP